MRSAYGLDSRPDLDWRRFGSCVDDPDLWCADSPAGVAKALALCHACPVRSQCHADAQNAPKDRRVSVVLGGVWYGQNGRPNSWVPKLPDRKRKITEAGQENDMALVHDPAARR